MFGQDSDGEVGNCGYYGIKYLNRKPDGEKDFLAINKRWSLRTMEIVYEVLVKKKGPRLCARQQQMRVEIEESACSSAHSHKYGYIWRVS